MESIQPHIQLNEMRFFVAQINSQNKKITSQKYIEHLFGICAIIDVKGQVDYMKIINDYDKWLILKAALIEKGYKPWQWQYGTHLKEGLHIWFWKENRNDVEVVTYNKKIGEDILNTRWS